MSLVGGGVGPKDQLPFEVRAGTDTFKPTKCTLASTVPAINEVGLWVVAEPSYVAPTELSELLSTGCVCVVLLIALTA